jgi:serine/threonine-protein kinase PpkA
MQVDIPGYRILKTLGKGGMARVYLAIQESFEREVALKVMSSHLSADEGFGERFLREARIVSRLVHPNIVTVYDVGVHDGHYFLSMEYVQGQELAFKHPQLSLSQCLNVIKDVAKALDYAGKKGYVHRDVKPENIMLHDEDSRAVLMDFGIARATDLSSGMTQTGMAIGTPHYMSPEQAKGQPVDPRADIYSLGVVLFLLLTGRLPYHADSAVVVGIMHVSEAIPQLPGHLAVFQPILERVLAKRPEDRYQTAAELIADLNQLTAEQIQQAEETRQQLLAEEEATNREATPAWVALASGDSLSGASDLPDAFENKASPVDMTVVSPRVAQEMGEAAPVKMSLRAEDRVLQAGGGHVYEKPGSSGYGWLMGLIVVALLGAGIYFKDRLLDTEMPDPLAQVQSQSSTPEVAAAEPQSVSAASVPEVEEVVAEAASSLVASEELADEQPVEQQISESPAVEEVVAEAIDEAANPESDGEALPADTDTSEVADVQESDASAAEDEAAIHLAQQLAQADAYLARDALGTPKGANAIETYRAILAEYPDQPEALAGLVRVAQRYGQLASAREQQGQLEPALEMVKRGLSLAPEDENLLAQRDKLNSQLAEQRRLLEREQQLVQAIKAALAEGNLTSAASQMAEAREEFPRSQALFELSMDVDQAIAEARPQINRLRVSHLEMTSLPDEQAPGLPADRVIHIGFSYRNFDQEAAVIQAVLYDGSRSLQIVQVPVVLTSKEGVRFFRMEKPVDGFAEGGYHIDLLLDQEPLISESFSVKR